MKLMTKKLEKRFEKIGTQETESDPLIIAKFFDPTGCFTWYAAEYDPIERMFFGLVDGHEKELGYFPLSELEAMKGKFGIGMERDLYFGEKRLSLL